MKKKLLIKISIGFFLVFSHIGFSQVVKEKLVKKGVLTIKGVITFDEMPIKDVRIQYFNNNTNIRNATPDLYSSADGNYEIKTSVYDFYNGEDRYTYWISKKGYKNKEITACLFLPKGIMKSAFTLELPLKMTPSTKFDRECGYITWSKEENNFIIKWYSCHEKKTSIELVMPEMGEKATLENVFFKTGKSEVLSSSFDELNKLADYLEKNKSTSIEISGHTDNIGREVENKKLSEARAKAVADYLVSKGIDKSRTSYKGYGSLIPVAKNETEEGKQKNRRVEFIIKQK